MNKEAREQARTLLTRVIQDLKVASVNLRAHTPETPISALLAIAILTAANNDIDVERLEEVLELID